VWLLENVKPTIYAERSGDACDHYHRFADDMALARSLGFNTWRFSLEWSRIEPEQGGYSTAELEHYRRILSAAHEAGLTPMVTLNHFTMPRWVAAQGGWEVDSTVDAFVRFTEFAARGLGDLFGLATTFNEPNLAKLLRWRHAMPERAQIEPMLTAAAKACGSNRFATAMYCDDQKMQDTMIRAHDGALAACKSGPGKYPVGINIAVGDEVVVSRKNRLAEKHADIYAGWFDAANRSDFLGVQAYTRTRNGPDGDLGNEPGVPLTQLYYEYWPESLEGAVRYAARHARVPIWVTENGVGTEDDRLRVDFLQRALPGLQQCIADGINVRGYVHWSLLDNYEWQLGFTPKFGLVAVDRTTQKRTPKPSAYLYGAIAKANAI
jgi:beta-glucosidase